MKKELKKNTLTRYCYICGKQFEAEHGRIIYCSELCEFKSWKEIKRAKANRHYRKITTTI